MHTYKHICDERDRERDRGRDLGDTKLHTFAVTKSCELHKANDKMAKMWSNKSYSMFTWKFIFRYHMSPFVDFNACKTHSVIIVVVQV